MTSIGPSNNNNAMRQSKANNNNNNNNHHSNNSPNEQQSESNSNFHVCVRIRPTSSPCFENQGHTESSKYVRTGPENSILFVQPHSTQEDKVFIFDEIFDDKCQTSDIFEKVVRPNLAVSLFKGFSHTILVYGMTGSGKTFTMFGDPNAPTKGSFSDSAGLGTASNEVPQAIFLATPSGIANLNSTEKHAREGSFSNKSTTTSQSMESNENTDEVIQIQASPQCESNSSSGLVNETVQFILAQVNSTNKSEGNSNESFKTKVRMSYLEIYNEQIRDLLSNSNELSSDNLAILEDPERGVYCPQLIEREIHSLESIQALIKCGNKRRVMASTKLNEFSSRSHAIIQLSLDIQIDKNEKTSTFLTPKLYMVDLAGSERASATESKGMRLKEGANINKSLLSLGNCITALSSQTDKKKQRHVPYRDSKLTRLLKESLGGNAKTLLIACVTPAFRFVEETINTLKYAQRAKCIHKDVYENMKQIYNQIEQKQQQQEQQITIEEQGGLVEFAEIESIKELVFDRQELIDREVRNELKSGFECKEGLLGVEIESGLCESELPKMTGSSVLSATASVIHGSEYFRAHCDSFHVQFGKLSEHLEDILQRNRELTSNLNEFINVREQNERMIHEIMDTINPAALTAKEMKNRVDKVNQLRGIVKHCDDAISKLSKELAANAAVKATIQLDLERLYEIKFIKDCQGLSNFSLYNTFEREKNALKAQVEFLKQEQRNFNELDALKLQQIANLKEEIQFMKRKAYENEMLLLQQQQQQQTQNVTAAKSKSRGRSNAGNTAASTATNNCAMTASNPIGGVSQNNNNNNMCASTPNANFFNSQNSNSNNMIMSASINIRGSHLLRSSTFLSTSGATGQKTPRNVSSSSTNQQQQQQQQQQQYSNNYALNFNGATITPTTAGYLSNSQISSNINNQYGGNYGYNPGVFPNNSGGVGHVVVVNHPSNMNLVNVPSKYMQVQTFVPSTNISVNTVRTKSANTRQSMYNMHQQQQQQQQVLGPNAGEMSPNSLYKREYEEYRRKEQIIESQLKHLTRNPSQKNVSRNENSNHSNHLNFTAATAAAANESTPLSTTNRRSSNRSSNLFARSSLSELKTNNKNNSSHFGANHNSNHLNSSEFQLNFNINNACSNNNSNGNNNTQHPNQENINIAVIELKRSNRSLSKNKNNNYLASASSNETTLNQTQKQQQQSEKEHSTFGEIFSSKAQSTSFVVSPKSKQTKLSMSTAATSIVASSMNVSASGTSFQRSSKSKDRMRIGATVNTNHLKQQSLQGLPDRLNSTHTPKSTKTSSSSQSATKNPSQSFSIPLTTKFFPIPESILESQLNGNSMQQQHPVIGGLKQESQVQQSYLAGQFLKSNNNIRSSYEAGNTSQPYQMESQLHQQSTTTLSRNLSPKYRKTSVNNINRNPSPNSYVKQAQQATLSSSASLQQNFQVKNASYFSGEHLNMSPLSYQKQIQLEQEVALQQSQKQSKHLRESGSSLPTEEAPFYFKQNKQSENSPFKGAATANISNRISNSSFSNYKEGNANNYNRSSNSSCGNRNSFVGTLKAPSQVPITAISLDFSNK